MSGAGPSASGLLPPLSRRLRHRLTRGWYAVAGGERELPTYFIVGAKRAGTTSLDEYVVDHPDVLRGLVEKGSRYYDVNFGRGRPWFDRHLPPRRAVDRIERRTGIRPIVGESSPYYCVHPLAAERIAADVPDARLLMCLRDPVARAWSHHRYEVARGFETLDFRSALEAEQARLSTGADTEREFAHRHFGYLARSRYAEQLAHLHRHFPAEAVLPVVSERLFEDPRTVMGEVFRHLGRRPHEQAVYDASKSLPPAAVPQAETRWLRERLGDDVAQLPGVLGFEPGWW